MPDGLVLADDSGARGGLESGAGNGGPGVPESTGRVEVALLESGGGGGAASGVEVGSAGGGASGGGAGD